MNSVSEKTINLSQNITLCGGGVLKSGKIIEEVKQFYLGWIIPSAYYQLLPQEQY